MTTHDAATDQLPPGKTCGDCRSYETCSFLIQQPPHSVTCDWIPSRFVPTKEPDRA